MVKPTEVTEKCYFESDSVSPHQSLTAWQAERIVFALFMVLKSS